ncbi:MAG: hypothetical protein EOO41_00725 [Methanobacteriota archaeon]|nr:MAG: hypothetical protein EOO41_00725 [Euryarchaeota archaeon]
MCAMLRAQWGGTTYFPPLACLCVRVDSRTGMIACMHARVCRPAVGMKRKRREAAGSVPAAITFDTRAAAAAASTAATVLPPSVAAAGKKKSSGGFQSMGISAEVLNGILRMGTLRPPCARARARTRTHPLHAHVDTSVLACPRPRCRLQGAHTHSAQVAALRTGGS